MALAVTSAPPLAATWAPQLESRRGQPGAPAVPVAAAEQGPPEHCQLRSASQKGRSIWHRNQFVPPHCQPELLQEPRRPLGEEDADHLLYLAIYRDKVDREHKRRAQESAASAARTIGGPLSKSGCGPTAGGSHPSKQAASTEPSGDRHGPAGAGKPGARCRVEQANERSARDGLATSNVASVSVRAAYGGVTSEYLEMARLGQLFEEWTELRRRRAEELGQEDEPPPRRPLMPGAVISSARSSDPAPGSRPELTSSLARTAASIIEGKLFRAVTDSSARGTCSLSGNAPEDRFADRDGPSHIEGFPTLKLMPLYRGPWRMNV